MLVGRFYRYFFPEILLIPTIFTVLYFSDLGLKEFLPTLKILVGKFYRHCFPETLFLLTILPKFYRLFLLYFTLPT
jgi:hypothetical protein